MDGPGHPTKRSRPPDDDPPGAPGKAPPRRSRSLFARIALAFVLLALVVAGGGGVAAVLVWRHFSRGLPDIPTLAQYRPPIITELVSADGQLAGELFVERRKIVPFERIPKLLVQALVASEDKNFFEHRGVDWLGTLRAGVNTYLLRRRVQGGSTITQQTAKSILVSAEGFEEGTRRNLRRKIRELILARRLEAALDEQELLWLYLNGVYLGHHSYGVQAAAENYFRKNAEDLTLPEAALLAGLPQAPSRYSPFSHPEAAKARRRYVLRELVERYGNERVLHHGLRVEMAMDLEKQRGAQAAMLAGLMEVDHRQGFLGPVAPVEGRERAALPARLARTWPHGALQPGDYAVWIVTAVEDSEALARVAVGTTQGILPISGMRWARKIG